MSILISEGTRIGPYLIIRPLAKGGMASVYLAKDTDLGRHVALKLDLSGRPKDQFLREGQILANISHPNIATVFGTCVEWPYQILVMELLGGGTLKDVLSSSDELISIPESTRIASQVLDALRVLHEKQILHRDLKPENIGFTTAGVPKLIDFGISRLVSEATGCVDGMIRGTPWYMAPEQYRSGQADVRSEVFSFGAIHYLMLTGRRPFDSEDLKTLASQIEAVDPTQPHLLRPEIPLDLSAVVMRALCKNPDTRFQTAADYLDTLRGCQSCAAVPSPATVPVLRKPNRWALNAAAVGVLLLVGLAGIGLAHRNGLDWETIKNLGTIEQAVLYKEPVRAPDSVEGTWEEVVLRATVDEHGRASGIRVQKSSGNAAVDECAKAALERWRFRPKRENWRPVPVQYEIRLLGPGSTSGRSFSRGTAERAN